MTAEQAVAFAQLRSLAAPYRCRVVADRGEGYPVIRGRYGDIEWHHAEGTHLAAYTAGSRQRLGRLLSLPGVIRHQVGDPEVRVLFPVATLPEVAAVLRARRRRVVPPDTRLRLHRVPEAAGFGGSGRTLEGEAMGR